MTEMTDDFAYGFFDGEGSIVHHHSALEVHVTQARRDVLEAFQSKYGGSIVIARRGDIADERVNGVRRQVWRWRLVGYAACRFLIDAEPHLIVKKNRAQAGIAWWRERVVKRSRDRMPDSYYAEAKAEGRKTHLGVMTGAERAAEMQRRFAWMAGKGWD